MSQHTASLGGSVSLPLERRARCNLSKIIGLSGDLSSKSLKMVVTAAGSWLGSMDSQDSSYSKVVASPVFVQVLHVSINLPEMNSVRLGYLLDMAYGRFVSILPHPP